MTSGMSVFNSLNSNTITTPVSAVQRGLLDVSKSTARIAEHLASHPDEMQAATQAAQAIGTRFGALVDAASQFDAGTAKLGNEVNEMAKTLDWLDYRFPNQSVTPSATLPVNNAFGGRIFNPGAIGSMPAAGCFSELLGQ